MKRMLSIALTILLCMLPLLASAEDSPVEAWDGRFFNLNTLNLSIEVAPGADILTDEEIAAIASNDIYQTHPTLIAQATEPNSMRLMITKEEYEGDAENAPQEYAKQIQEDILAQLGDSVAISSTSKTAVAESIAAHFTVESDAEAQDYYVLYADGIVYVITFRYDLSLADSAQQEIMLRFLQI